jgi:hypothetical protein
VKLVVNLKSSVEETDLYPNTTKERPGIKTVRMLNNLCKPLTSFETNSESFTESPVKG